MSLFAGTAVVAAAEYINVPYISCDGFRCMSFLLVRSSFDVRYRHVLPVLRLGVDFPFRFCLYVSDLPDVI